MGARRRYFRMANRNGFTLVELMVVVAIVAILATVAAPAYINYVNRTKQGQAESMLMTARVEEEEFYAENGWYASTIQCLPSFIENGNTICLSACDNPVCANLSAPSPGYYSFTAVSLPGTANTLPFYRITATRTFPNLINDVVTISATTDTPTVQNPGALGFSVFKWLFNQ